MYVNDKEEIKEKEGGIKEENAQTYEKGRRKMEEKKQTKLKHSASRNFEDEGGSAFTWKPERQ